MLQWASLGLEGFRVIARKTYSFYTWALIYFAGVALVIFPSDLAAGPHMSGDPRARIVRELALLVFLPVLASALICATYRSILQPQASRFAYLRLGWPEARVAVLLFLVEIIVAMPIIAASQGGPFWGIVVGLGAIALLARIGLLGPALFQGGASPVRAAWRLARPNYRGILVMTVIALTVSAFVSVTITSVYTYVAESFAVRAAATRAELLWRLYPAMAPLVMGWTASLVIAVAPAAAACRLLVPDEDEQAAKAFG